MDGDLLEGISPSELSRLSPSDQREVSQFVQNEQQKAMIQGTIHNLTEKCFKKCVFGTSLSSGRLSAKESSCMENCVGRFMDSTTSVLKHLETIRGGQ